MKVPLTVEERNDLRKKVLQGHDLSLDEAKAVIESLRQGQGVAALAGEAKAKGGRKKVAAISDDQLDADLKGLGL
jgi:hypothetical protein